MVVDPPVFFAPNESSGGFNRMSALTKKLTKHTSQIPPMLSRSATANESTNWALQTNDQRSPVVLNQKDEPTRRQASSSDNRGLNSTKEVQDLSPVGAIDVASTFYSALES